MLFIVHVHVNVCKSCSMYMYMYTYMYVTVFSGLELQSLHSTGWTPTLHGCLLMEDAVDITTAATLPIQSSVINLVSRMREGGREGGSE